MIVNAVETATNVRRIPVIGIVGGIGSGKSAIARWVATQADIEVVDADVLGHEALLDHRVRELLCQRFGREILGSNGEIDRTSLARLVFGSNSSQRDARRDLELIVHPEIGRRISLRIESAASLGRSAVLLDAAVLLEAGWKNKCDIVVFIDTPDAGRLDRVRKNRGWSEEELRRRESSQWRLTDKRREADWIVENRGEIQHAGRQLLDLFRQNGLVNQDSIS